MDHHQIECLGINNFFIILFLNLPFRNGWAVKGRIIRARTRSTFISKRTSLLRVDRLIYELILAFSFIWKKENVIRNPLTSTVNMKKKGDGRLKVKLLHGCWWRTCYSLTGWMKRRLVPVMLVHHLLTTLPVCREVMWKPVTRKFPRLPTSRIIKIKKGKWR